MSFKQIQHTFIQHIKDPQQSPFDGIEDRRLKIYRELFFNNILGFLSSGFPVLQSLYSEQVWQNLARQFFVNHDCSSPYFVDISKEFVEFLSSEYQLTTDDPVFIRELAHYEWLELDVSIRKAHQAFVPWSEEKDTSVVQLSDLATLVSYPYPVHQISVDFQPSEAGQEVYLVVYRNFDDEVNFTQVNQVTAHLLNTLGQHEFMNVDSLCYMMSEAMPQLEPQQVHSSVKQVIQQLLAQQILLPIEN